MTQLSETEKKYVKNKEWMYKGEANAKERPVNSLLNCELEFKQAKVVTKQKESDENEILMLVKARLREKKFDNITFRIENDDESDSAPNFKPSDASAVLNCEEVEDLLDVLNVELMRISDLNNNICEFKRISTKRKTDEHAKNSRSSKSSAIKELKKHKNVQIL